MPASGAAATSCAYRLGDTYCPSSSERTGHAESVGHRMRLRMKAISCYTAQDMQTSGLLTATYLRSSSSCWQRCLNNHQAEWPRTSGQHCSSTQMCWASLGAHLGLDEERTPWVTPLCAVVYPQFTSC